MFAGSIYLLSALLLNVFRQVAAPQPPIHATTETDRQVSLLPDGSWRYDGNSTVPEKKLNNEAIRHKTTAETQRIALPYGDAILWIDPLKWKQTKTEDGRINFTRDGGKLFGMVISENFGGIPTDAMEKLALTNAKQTDPNARVLVREHRVVNGKELLYMEFEARSQGIPFHFAGYYHGGVKTDLQVLGFTLGTEFDRLKPELEEFLNGIEIREASTPSAVSTVYDPNFGGVLRFGSFQLKYDPEKWTAKETEETGTWMLTNKRGDAYGKFIAERTAIPLDSLIAVAMQRVQEEDKHAHIVSQEDRTISGLPAKQLRIDVSPSGIPMTFLGYYYGGDAGAVQVIGYTGRQLFDDYKGDFEELLKGLTISAPGHQQGDFPHSTHL